MPVLNHLSHIGDFFDADIMVSLSGDSAGEIAERMRIRHRMEETWANAVLIEWPAGAMLNLTG